MRSALVNSAGLLAWLSLAIASTGCITIQEFRALEREVADLKSDRSVGLPGGDARVAQLGARVDELERDMQRLRGELEETRHALDQARKQAKRDARSPPPPAGPAGDVSPTSAASQEVRDYEDAFRVYRLGEYQTAIDRFRRFLQNYPSSDYADNALFWMGECHAKLGDHERAVLTFQDVVKEYPDGNKVPDALFRQGIALLELGRQTRQQDTYGPAAREIFNRILTDYPNSERVPEAKRQLERLL